MRGPAARGAPRASRRRERGCRLSSPRHPSSASLGSPHPALPPQRCPARSPASQQPPPLPLCSLSPPARSQPPRRCRRINMADGRVRATSRGRERGRAELRLSPAPGAARGPPRPQPSHSSGCRLAAVAVPARVCVRCPVRLSSEGRSSTSRSQIHSGKKASRPPVAVLPSLPAGSARLPRAAPVPASTGAARGPAGGCPALSVTGFLGTETAGLSGVLKLTLLDLVFHHLYLGQLFNLEHCLHVSSE